MRSVFEPLGTIGVGEGTPMPFVLPRSPISGCPSTVFSTG